MSARRKRAPADATAGDATPPRPGGRRRARSADHARSRSRLSDQLSTSTTTITTNATTATTNTTIHSGVSADWTLDRTHQSYPGALNSANHHHNHLHHHHHHHTLSSGGNACNRNDRLYHSDRYIHYDPDEQRSRCRGRRSRQNLHHNHHHHHHHHHHHQSNRHASHSSSSQDNPHGYKTFYYSEQDLHHHHDEELQPRRRRRRNHHRHHASESSLPSSSSDSTSYRSRSSSVPERGTTPTSRETLNLSLCGCGFLGVYHLGVVSCLLKHGPSFLQRVDRVAGASAGSLAAALLVTSPTLKTVEASTEMVEALAKTIRRKPLGALTPGYRMAKDLERLLDKVLPPDAHELARGKLHVSLTDVKTKQNEIVCDFESRQELIQTLVASCHIPVYSGTKTPALRGKYYCDGGWSNNLVEFKDGRTVTVSPFSGKQDIGPRDTLKKGSMGYFFSLNNHDFQVNFNNVRRLSHAFFPPRSYILQQYFELGHKDASRFLAREGLYEITMPSEEDKMPIVYESSV